MIFGVPADDLAKLMGPAGVLLTIVGGGLGWLIKRADARAQAREDDFEARIAKLEDRIERMARREASLLQHVFELRAMMTANGLTVPPLPQGAMGEGS